MSEKTLQRLTWATLIAAAASALLLAALGCALPELLRSADGRLWGLVDAVAECSASAPLWGAAEFTREAWDADLPLPRW